jgi:hypothetical protein
MKNVFESIHGFLRKHALQYNLSDKFRKIIPVFPLFLVLFAGCGVEPFLPPDILKPPAELKAYPHNGTLTLVFKSYNDEEKLDGFNVYISSSSSIKSRPDTPPLRNSDSLPTILLSRKDIVQGNPISRDIIYSSGINQLENGTTYYVTMKAHNYDNVESEFCNEVSTTPRVESMTQATVLMSNGFSLAQGKALQPWDFQIASYNGLTCIYSAANLIKDEGWVQAPMLYNKVSDAGFPPAGTLLQIIPGHIYILKTPAPQFGKIYIQSAGPASVTFSWAFQSVIGNLDI